MALDVVTVEYNIQIEKSKQALNDLEQSYRKSDQAATQSANKVTEAYQKPAGILQKLQGQLKVLQDAQQKAFSPASVISLQRKIDETKGKIAALTGEINKSGGSMVSTFKNVAASVGLAFSVQQILRFGKELVNLALDAEEVKLAFKNLNNANILDEVRKAVSGTVDDVTLMKSILKADSLTIPLEELALLFEFAERKAGALGLTTEQAFESIIQAIGARSPKAFTSLGISVFDVQEKLKGLNFETATIADVSRGMSEIFRSELDKMGESVDSNSDKVARLNAGWTNFKTTIGEGIVSALVTLTDFSGNLTESVKEQGSIVNEATAIFEGWTTAIGEAAGQLANLGNLANQASGAIKGAGLAGGIIGNPKDDVESINSMQERLSELNKAIGEVTTSEATRQALTAQAKVLSEQITIAQGGETEAMKAHRAEVEKNIQEYQKWLEIQKEIAKEKERQGLILEPADAQIPSPEPAEKLADSLENLRVKLKTLQEQAEDGNLSAKLLEDKIAFEEMVRSMQQTANTLNAISNIYNGLNEIISEGSKQRLEDELELIERQKEAQLESLDKQLENEKLSAKQRESILKQRAALEEDFEKKTEQAREEAAKKQLKFTIAGIILNQSAAIASAIAGAVAQAAGNPIGIAAILAITLPLILSGMAQAMSAANAVELAEGEVGLKGPGSTKSDSIPARLSRGESVITAEGTNLDPDLLRAMNKGAAAFEEHIQHTYVWPYMEAMIKAHSKPEGRGMTFNDRNILKRLDIGNKLQIKTTQALLNALNKKESKRRYWS